MSDHLRHYEDVLAEEIATCPTPMLALAMLTLAVVSLQIALWALGS